MAERIVSWKALADFAAVTREARKSQRALEDLRKKQAQLNSESRRGGVDVSGTENVSKVATDSARASEKAAGAANKNATAQQRQVTAMRAAERASRDMSSGMRAAADAADEFGDSADKAVRSTKKLADTSKATVAARQAEASAARQVAIAEARLQELRDSGKAKASQLLAAEDRLARSHERLAATQERLARSSDNAGRGFGNMGRGLRNLDFDGPNRGGGRFAGTLAKMLVLLPAVLGGINALVAAVGPLAAGITGLAGAIAPVSGLLATLPGLLLAVVGSAGTLVAGFSGIGGALKAYQKQQDAAAKATANAAKTQQQAAVKQLQAQRQQESALKRVRDADNAARQAAEQNARAIRDAKRGVTDAQESAARAAESSARAIDDAERGLAEAQERRADNAEESARRVYEAQRSLRDAQESQAETLETSQRSIAEAERSLADAQIRAVGAQEGITAARIRAQQQIDELKDSLKDLALQEEGASLSVEEARLRLQRTLNDPASTDLERRSAELAVREAEARLGDVRDSQKQNDEALKQAQKKGIEGSDEVVQAKNDEAKAQNDLIDAQNDLIEARNEATKATRDAAEAVEDARRTVAEAEKDQAKDARDSAQSVIDAQRSMTDAREEAARSARDSSRAVADAQERLNDAYRDSRRRTEEAQEAIQEANQSLGDLAITTAGSDGAAPAVDEFAEAMKNLTPEARAVVRQLIKMKPLIDEIRKTAQRGLMPGVLSFLQDIVKLFPLVNEFVGKAAKSFGDFFARIGNITTSKKALDGWKKILDSTNRVIDKFLDGAENIAVVLGRIAIAAIPLTEWLADTVVGWTEAWEAMTAGEEGQKRLTKFFDKTRAAAELLGDIVGNLVGTLYYLGKGTQDLGKWMLENFRDMTQGWVDFLSSVEGQEALKEWAENSKAPLAAMAGLLGDLLRGLIEIGKDVDLTKLINQVREDLVPAFLDFMKVFSDEDMTGTLIRLFASLLRIATALAESGVLDLIVQGLEDFAAALEWVMENVPGGDKLIAGILVALGALQILRFTGLTKAIGGIVSALKGIPTAAKKAAEALKKVKAPKAGDAKGGGTPKGGAKPGAAPKIPSMPKVDIWSTIKQNLPAVGAVLLQRLPQIGSWILRTALPAIGRLAAAIPGIGWIIAIVATALSIALPLIIDNWEQISDFLVTKTQEVKDAVEEKWKEITDALAGPIEDAKTAIQDTLDKIRDIFDVFVQIGVAIFKTSAGLIYAFIVRPFQLAFRWVKEKLEEFGKWLGEQWETIKRGVEIIWKGVYDHLIKPIQDFFTWIGLKFTEFKQWLTDRFNEFVTGIQKIWDTVYGKLIKPVQDFIGWIGRKLTEFGQWLWQKFQAIVAEVKKKWDAFYDTVVRPVQRVLKPITDKIGEVVRNIKAGLQVGLDWLTDKWTKFTDWVTAPIKAVIKALEKPLSDIWNSIVDAFNGIMGALSKAWNGFTQVIMDPIGSAISGLNDFIRSVRELFRKLQVPEDLWPDTIDPPGVKRAPDWKPAPAQRAQLHGRKDGGFVPGVKSNVHRDNVLGVSRESKQPVAYIEPGEYVAPRWMSPIFGTLESIRRRGRSALDGYREGGFLTGGTQPASGPTNRHSSGYSWANWAGDIPAPMGSPVMAYKDGQVSATKYWNYSYGNHIKINHGSGEKTLYAHLSQILTRAGAGVNQGQLIGRVGSTGNSTGPHLHFELSGGTDPIKIDSDSHGFSNPIADAVNQLLGNLSPAKWLKEQLGNAQKNASNPWAAMVFGAGKTALDTISGIAQKYFGIGDPSGAPPGSFGSGTAGVDGSTGPNSRKAAADVGPKFGFKSIGTYSGHDPSESRALDFMTSNKPQGDAAAKYMKDNAKRLGVMYLIWYRKIWSVARNSEGWRPYTRYGNTSNPSQAHTNHVHASFYAKGTNSAKQGPIVVGENGPELMYARGGERIQKNQIARQNLPKYHEGGYVNGMQPGGRGNWVRALRSQLGLGISDGWSTTLQKALQKKDPQPVGSFKLNAGFMKKVADLLKKVKGIGFWDVAKRLKVDPSYLWRHGSDKGLWGAFKKYKVPGDRATRFRNGWRDYSNARHAGVKDLEKRLGLKQDGIWGSEITAPLAHALDHMFKRPHDALASRPWKALTPTELALQEQRRTNSLNAEWDKLLKGFEGQKLTYVVRKLKELGTADGLSLARDLNKSTLKLRQEYDRNLKVEYDRADAQDSNTEMGKIQLFVQAVGSGTAAKPVGLQGASSAAQVSLDTGAMLYDKINAQKLWGSVSSTQRKRVDGDVSRFRKLFRFRVGGQVPGYGNGDRVHLLGEPGEFMLRKNAVSALTRDFGKGFVPSMNQYDRMANGGFVAGGVGRPGASIGAINISRGKTSETSNAKTVTNNFYTNIHNPTLEDGAVSLQKRVTRIARLGLLDGDK